MRRPFRILHARRALIAVLALASVLPAAQAARRLPAHPPPAAQAPAPAPVPQAAESAVTAPLPEQAPLDRQIDMIRRILPQAKRVGIIYNPGQPTAAAAVKQLLDLLPKAGMNPVEITAPRQVDVGPAVRNLIGRVDLVYTIFDDNVTAEYDIVARTCDEAHIPLFAADPANVRRGAIASLGLAGKEAAPAVKAAAARPVRPERPVAGPRLDLYINPDAAARQGVALSDAVLKSAVLVSQANSSPRGADGVKHD
ncbi:MAG TPA: ABC transporter substrate binding protein [Bordetella sp.]